MSGFIAMPRVREPGLPTWLKSDPRGCILFAYARPGANDYAITGEFNGRLRIAIPPYPYDNKANIALVAFLAEKLSCPKANVKMLFGQSARSKTLLLVGQQPARVAILLAPPPDKSAGQ